MRHLVLAVLLLGAGAAEAADPVIPAWFTSGPRYERAAKCIAAILFYPQIEENGSELGILQRAIANDGQMDTDLQLDIRTEGDPPRLRQLDMVMRHIYMATRNFQSQTYGPAVYRTSCRKFEAELAR